MRALHSAELDNRHSRLRRSLRGTVHAFFQLGAGILKWPRAEVQDVACKCALAVGANQQPIRVRALRVGENNRNLSQSWHLGGTNLSHLPRDRGIVAEHLEEEGVDGVFSGKNRRACIGGRSGHWFGRRSSLESGHRLSDSDAGQQNSSEQCAMHACHILEFQWNSIVTKTAAVVISDASLVEIRPSPPGHHGTGRGERPVAPPNLSSSRARGARTRPWPRSEICAHSQTPWRRS